MKRVIILVSIAFTAAIIGYFITINKERSLPIINPIDIVEEMVDSTMLRKGYGHKIGDFSFKNQNGKYVTEKDVEDKIFVVEYFFTTCVTICPKMNVQMQRIQTAYKGNENVKLLSFTVNPEIDTVEQMKRFALSHDADDNQWSFLTGDKKDLYHLARTSFFVLKPAEAQNLGDAGSDFIHTNNFVLVDKQKRIRGYYDGTSQKEVDLLIKDIELLLKEK